MPMNVDNATLAALLPRLQGLKVERVTHLQGNQIVLTLTANGGKTIQFTAAILESLSETEIPLNIPSSAAAARAQSRGIQEARGDNLILQISPEEAREQGLPVYWSVLPDGRPWLEGQLQELFTMEAVAEKWGLSYRTLSDFARRHQIKNPHGAGARSARNAGRKEEARRLIAEGKTQAEVAKQLGINAATLWRWLK